MYTGKWTDEETIKNILQSSRAPNATVKDEPLLIPASDPAQLEYSGLDNNVVVKQARSSMLFASAGLVLNGVVPVVFTSGALPIRGSVVLSSTTPLTNIFAEDFDYVVDYTSTTLRRTASGSTIVSGSTNFAWCLEWTVLVEGIDYVVNYEAGQISRIGGSSIAPGVTVYVDYSHALSIVSDAAIKECIQQAEGEMLLSIADKTMQSDALRSAATLYALSLIALSQATKILATADSTADERSKYFIQLSTEYRMRASAIFSYFAQDKTYLLGGGVIQNRFIGSREHSTISPTVSLRTRKR
jgi:hypothetical protein